MVALVLPEQKKGLTAKTGNGMRNSISACMAGTVGDNTRRKGGDAINS
jgi:hypothetical protein